MCVLYNSFTAHDLNEKLTILYHNNNNNLLMNGPSLLKSSGEFETVPVNQLYSLGEVTHPDSSH